MVFAFSERHGARCQAADPPSGACRFEALMRGAMCTLCDIAHLAYLNWTVIGAEYPPFRRLAASFNPKPRAG